MVESNKDGVNVKLLLHLYFLFNILALCYYVGLTIVSFLLTSIYTIKNLIYLW